MCPQDFGTKIQNNAHHLTGFKRSWYTIKNTIVYLWQSTQCFISTKGEPPNWTRARKFNYIVNVFTICITYVNRENCCSFYPSVLLFMHNKTKDKNEFVSSPCTVLAILHHLWFYKVGGWYAERVKAPSNKRKIWLSKIINRKVRVCMWRVISTMKMGQELVL